MTAGALTARQRLVWCTVRDAGGLVHSRVLRQTLASAMPGHTLGKVLLALRSKGYMALEGRTSWASWRVTDTLPPGERADPGADPLPGFEAQQPAPVAPPRAAAPSPHANALNSVWALASQAQLSTTTEGT